MKMYTSARRYAFVCVCVYFARIFICIHICICVYTYILEWETGGDEQTPRITCVCVYGYGCVYVWVRMHVECVVCQTKPNILQILPPYVSMYLVFDASHACMHIHLYF